MSYDDIMDELAHAFLLEKMKRELEGVSDPVALRRSCLMLIDLLEKQKSLFKQMLYSLLDGDPEAQEMFE